MTRRAKACQREGAARQRCGGVQRQVSSGPGEAVRTGRVKAKAGPWQSPSWKGLVPGQWAAANWDLHLIHPDCTPHTFACSLPSCSSPSPTHQATATGPLFLQARSSRLGLHAAAGPSFWVWGRRLGRNQPTNGDTYEDHYISVFWINRKNYTHLPAFVLGKKQKINCSI